MSDEEAMRHLTRPECWHHLRQHPSRIGRVGFLDDGLPVILPVNYRVDGESVVFRTGPGAKLAAATNGHMLAFQVDDVDIAWQAGWGVLLRGKGEHITERGAIARLEELGLRPWAPGPTDHWVRLRPVRVDGRELS